jgi:O-antigen/teichoic acid export membrane protein
MLQKGQSDLFNNILTVVSGTVIAQLIPILLQPILRRMYLPEDFGLFGVYTSIIGIVTVISTLRYSQTINIPKNDIVATNLFALSFIIAFIIYVILTIFIFIFNDSILKIFGIPGNRSFFLYFIPFSAFLFSTFEVINFWLIRKKEFKLAALNKIYRRSTEGIINVGLGIRGFYFGLIFGDIIGNIANVFSGVRRLKLIKFNLRDVSIKKIFFVAKKYSDMPKFNLLPQTLNSICLFLPPLLINKFYSSETAGYFNLTLLVLNIPIVFIGNSISDVLIQRISDRKNNKLSN